jgi:hypothetical protein
MAASGIDFLIDRSGFGLVATTEIAEIEIRKHRLKERDSRCAGAMCCLL